MTFKGCFFLHFILLLIIGDNVNKHRAIALMIIAILILLSISLYAAYSLSNVFVYNENMQISTVTSNGVKFSVSRGDGIVLNVTEEDMTKANVGNVVASDTDSVSVTLESDAKNEICCSYAIYWAWQDYNMYLRYNNSDTIMIYAVYNEGAYNNDSLNNYIQNRTLFAEKSIPYMVEASSYTPVVYEGSICNGSNNMLNAKVVQNITFTTSFYNRNYNQASITNYNLNGSFKFVEGRCSAPTLNDKIIASVGTTTDASTGSQTGIIHNELSDDIKDSLTFSEYLNSEANPNLLGGVGLGPGRLNYINQFENYADYLYYYGYASSTKPSERYFEYIYVGQNPNNYIQFDDGLWRIIGLYKYYDYNNNEVLAPMIIKNDSIGNFKFDNKNGVGSSVSEYGSNYYYDSQLLALLNNESNYHYYDNEYYLGFDSNTGYASANGTNILKNYGSYVNGKDVYIPASVSSTGLIETSGALLSRLNGGLTINQGNLISSEYIYMAQGMPSDASSLLTSKVLSDIKIIDLYNYHYVVNDNIIIPYYDNSFMTRNNGFASFGLLEAGYYGFATGGSNGAGTGREACLNKPMTEWGTSSSLGDCAKYNWLLYTGSTSGALGSRASQWTVTPDTSGKNNVYVINSNGYITSEHANSSFAVRPVTILSPDYMIVSGNGTSSDPYILNDRKLDPIDYISLIQEELAV